jgi:DNA-binding transcriptional MerR regulator
MDERNERYGAGQARGRPAQVPPGRNVSPPPAPDRYRYSIAELEEQTGFSARTIRYYVSKALLPPAHGRGPTATYDLSHLLRLRAIQRRRQEGVLLEEIKAELDDLSDEQIADMLEVRTDPIEDRWRRILLHDDIELHIRERGGQPRDPRFAAAVEQIIKLARVVVDDLNRGTA